VTPAPDHSVAHRPADRAVSGTSRLELSGALTRADAPWLEPELERLAHGSAAVVEVELSDVPSMDAHVARLLLRTSWHLGDPARRLLLVHPQPLVHRVLRYYGAGDLVVRAPRPKGRRRS
jgi:anti-anti-sigma regulatory factor